MCPSASGAGPRAARDPTEQGGQRAGSVRSFAVTVVVGDSDQGLSPTGHLDVTMAATNLENQLHSAQKNLLFLQREHAGTLKGLHAEIRRLQQHCTGAGQGRAAGRAGAGAGCVSAMASPRGEAAVCGHAAPPSSLPDGHAPGTKAQSCKAVSGHAEHLKDQNALVRIYNAFGADDQT